MVVLTNCTGEHGVRSEERSTLDESGQLTFQSANGHIVIDHFIASEQCMSAAQTLHVLEEASRYCTDDIPLILHVASEMLIDANTAIRRSDG